MSPYEIEIILHYHWSKEDCPMLDSSPATNETCERLVSAGILKRVPEGMGKRYEGNFNAIQAYVEAICAIPLPIMKWVVEPVVGRNL